MSTMDWRAFTCEHGAAFDVACAPCDQDVFGIDEAELAEEIDKCLIWAEEFGRVHGLSGWPARVERARMLARKVNKGRKVKR